MKNSDAKSDGGLLVRDGRLVGYIFAHEDRAWEPGGLVTIAGRALTPEEIATHNKLLSAALIDGLDNRCEIGQGGTFYYNADTAEVKTWTGELVAVADKVGARSIRFSRAGKVFNGRLSGEVLNFRRIA